MRYKIRLALVYICLIGSTLLSLAVPRFLGLTIDLALEGDDTRLLVLLALLILVISMVRGAFAYAQSYFAEEVSQRVSYDIRHALLSHLLSLGLGFHQRQNTGDLMSRATADVDSIRWMVSFGLVYAIQILILLVGVTVLLLITNRDLALIALSVIPFAIYIAIRMSHRFRALWRTVQTNTGLMTTVLQENLSGIRVVKSFGAEEHEKMKFAKVAHSVSQTSFIVNRLHATNTSILSLLFSLVTALVIWYGGTQILPTTSSMTAGDLTQFILYLGLLVGPIRMSGWVVNVFSRAVSAGERIYEVLDAPFPLSEKSTAISIDRAKGRIKLENVSFGHDTSFPRFSSLNGSGNVGPNAAENLQRSGGNRHDTLHRVSLEVYPGQNIAILGAPGSGKTTLVNLIARFYDATQGKVSLDGIPVADITLESLRRNVGVVLQDVFLFIATVRDNIAYGAPKASLEQVIAAARSAQIHDFIMNLPQQYDTLVGERGVTLSGGQRQRIAIARTLLMDPPVLVLDDSTSSVDVETETHLQRAIEELMEDRTTFVIAHRISSVKRADLIIVLENGEIIERGTHEELISREGPYQRIYSIQVQAGEDVLSDTWLQEDGR